MKIFPGFVIWLTGLPSSSKTVLANALSVLLSAQGISVQVLDSNELRRKLTPHPTYSAEERDWYYDIIVLLAKLLTDNGVNVLIAATAPRPFYREAARSRLKRFAEVYVDCEKRICRGRDPKRLWERAEKGEIATVPGAGVPYEPPLSPDVPVDTSQLSVEGAARYVLNELERRKYFLPRNET